MNRTTIVMGQGRGLVRIDSEFGRVDVQIGETPKRTLFMGKTRAGNQVMKGIQSLLESGALDAVSLPYVLSALGFREETL